MKKSHLLFLSVMIWFRLHEFTLKLGFKIGVKPSLNYAGPLNNVSNFHQASIEA